MALSSEQSDKTDRMLHPDYFHMIERKIGHSFTLDACSNATGDSALCTRFCSLKNSFFKHDCSGETVWLNPPFTPSTMKAMLRHYLSCKLKAPHITSACILLPDWIISSLKHYLEGMTPIHCFKPHAPVMTVPPNPNDPNRERLIFNSGLPFGMTVFYDPPQPLDSPLSRTLSMTTVPPEDINNTKALMANCTIGKSTPATIHLSLNPSALTTMAIDTLASRNFIDANLVQSLKVRIKQHPPWLSNVITLGDNTQRQTLGLVHINIQMGTYHDMIWCEVLDLPAEFQLILGQGWLTSHHCILNFSNATCTLYHNGRRHIIQCNTTPNLSHTTNDLPMDYPSFHTPPLISAMQTKRLLRKDPILHPSKCFLILLEQSEPSSIVAFDDHPKDLQAILNKHQPTLSDPPSTLPPERDITHGIDLIPHSQPPHRPVYRLSLTERKEIQTTIQDLLTKGHIEPSTSPYGAPILFVGKKDGTLRMCVDYRALNKLTIKNRYPLPRIDDLLDQLHGAQYFSSLDLASGYHQIRIKESDVIKTAFNTPLGHFQWRVMPFGLCNAPATFQNAMNNLFGHRIGQYVLVYMDDILVYSKTREEHLSHLDEVLSLLHQHQYYVKPKKCDFLKTEVKFLGHIISQDGLKVDPDKINTVKQWQAPKDKSSIRSLLGFGNYFRKFIYHYSDMVLPLTELTQAKVPTTWTPSCQQAFNNLKNAIIHAPVLKHPELGHPFQLICDASNYASGAILVQDDHPCAFASKKFSPAECNYTTEDRELLAIIHALKLFRCYLDGTPFTILTDHNPLKYFDTKQDLSPRQARWAQYLSRFDYQWEWIKGKNNPADFLSRHLPNITTNPNAPPSMTPNPNSSNPTSLTTLSPILTRTLKKRTPPTKNPTLINDCPPSTSYLPMPSPKRTRKSQRKKRYSTYSNLLHRFHSSHELLDRFDSGNTIPMEIDTDSSLPSQSSDYLTPFSSTPPSSSHDTTPPTSEPPPHSSPAPTPNQPSPSSSPPSIIDLTNLTDSSNQHDESDDDLEPSFQHINLSLIKQGYEHDNWFSKPFNLQGLTLQNGLWRKDNLIVLPRFQNLRQWAISECHDTKYAGHLGVTKTLALLKRIYWWKGMKQHVYNYVRSCHSCQRNKPSQQSPPGLLQPLPIPSRPWTSISMDLITSLPQTDEGHDSIVTVVDRLTKMVHFFPCSVHVTAAQLANLFLNNIFRLHGLPTEIISDRDPRFISAFWKEFCKLLGTKQNLTSPYHPESDGQTERMNRILEEMLRQFVAPHQQDWNLHLPTCEFAINNAPQESTKTSPFYLTYGYHPLTPANLINHSSVPAAEELHEQLKQNLTQAQDYLHAAQQRQKLYYDSSHRVQSFQEGDMVLLSTKNIGLSNSGTFKLLPRYVGPFKVLSKVGELAYRLQLPPTMRIHNVFHISKLKQFHDDGRMQPPPPPTIVDGEEEYEVDSIINHRDIKRGKSTRREYLVRWKGYGIEHDEFIPEKDLKNAQAKIVEYWLNLEG